MSKTPQSIVYIILRFWVCRKGLHQPCGMCLKSQLLRMLREDVWGHLGNLKRPLLKKKKKKGLVYLPMVNSSGKRHREKDWASLLWDLGYRICRSVYGSRKIRGDPQMSQDSHNKHIFIGHTWYLFALFVCLFIHCSWVPTLSRTWMKVSMPQGNQFHAVRSVCCFFKIEECSELLWEHLSCPGWKVLRKTCTRRGFMSWVTKEELQGVWRV